MEDSDGDAMGKSDPEREFYRGRNLPEPESEYRPENLGQLREVVTDRSGERPLVVLGGGEHLRERAIGARPFDVVRTDRCAGLRALDVESNVVRVEAGTTWGELRERLRERDCTLARYGPFPEDATVGGLLGRHQPLEKQLFTGDLREGCVALTTVSPGIEDYEYIPAPRKASGPDHRYLYIGGEGFAGAILEATLVVWPEQDARLFVHPAREVETAIEAYRSLAELDVRISWCCWSSSEERFEAALHGPTELLLAHEQRLRSEFGDEGRLERGRLVRERRRRWESDHPGARSGADAERTCAVVWNLEDVADGIGALDDELEEAVVDRWSPRRARVHLVAADATAGWKRDDEPFERRLSFREVVDGGESSWPSWSRRLKEEFDPDGRLAVGPH